MNLLMGRINTALSIMIVALAGTRADADGCLFDAHDRDVTSRGVTLVDWDGQIANPLIPLRITPPADFEFPMTVTLTADDTRIYFNMPSATLASGPRKVMLFETWEPLKFYVSIYPDRDGEDELHTMTITFIDAERRSAKICVDVRVIDQDRNEPGPFQIRTDFSCDESGLFKDPKARAVVEQAAADWAYFIDDMNLDVVGPGQEGTYIWNYPLAWDGPRPRGRYVSNPTGYRGFLLYALGVQTPDHISRGGASPLRVQHVNGVALPLRRSGAIMIQRFGGFNTLGWIINNESADWWCSANQKYERRDLYSVALHEVGHALAFDVDHPGFRSAKKKGLTSPRLSEYLDKTVPYDGDCHFDGIIDTESGVGAFGNKYDGWAPARRWTISKLDLMLMEAVGYKLRKTSALEQLDIEKRFPPIADVGAPYEFEFKGRGGVPAYRWFIAGGTLPDGLALDSFTGEVTGTPTIAGLYKFNLAVSDAWNATTCVANQSMFVREVASMGTMRAMK